MSTYQSFVSGFTRLVQEAKSQPLGGLPAPLRPAPALDAPRVLIFSPHPDDEVIIGGLAFRLAQEAQWNVLNVAVTQGSKKERQLGRWRELQACCQYIGFGLIATGPTGLERIHPKTREQDPAAWAHSVQVIAGILAEQQPRVILFPHELDWNSTHIGTHWLVMDALKSMPPRFACYTVETEFWGQMPTPNLMVELSANQLAELITALTFHTEEVKRNPYHLTLPAWMMDNVRRGAELVGGQGGAAPNYSFATLYRLRKWQEGRLVPVFEGGKQVSVQEQAVAWFPKL